MDVETKKVSMKENPIAQGTGSGDAVIVYPDRVELRSSMQNQNTFSVGLRQVASVRVRGLINCALTIEINDGHRINVENMALPDARQVKAAIEHQKRVYGLEESHRLPA